ncbi:type II and III secretion system protein family protein [Massilia sp. S19_KUP03_FR1]|uniref:type II and III secretion system protein family protein n=1 Tax=Massilia sp. S19_KUP03_FR1 TaxID=3025503 RepID=UPI002FCD64A3
MNLSRHTGGVLASVFALVMAIVLLVLPSAPAHSASVPDLELYAGEAKVLPLAPSRIAIGNGKIISASSLAGKQLLVLAETAGTTTLHLWLKNGTERVLTVTVREANVQATLEDVKRLLTSVENVTARVAGSKIVLEGDMVSDTNQERVQAIQKMFPEQVVNFVGKVGWEKMIYLDVKVLELSTKGSRDLGIRWDSSINGPNAGVLADFYSNSTFRYVPPAGTSGIDLSSVALPGKVWSPQGFINLTSLITSRINLLVQDGEAEVLAAPSLTTRSGSKARFVAGGEIPLPVVSALGQSEVQMKEYGVILEVTPVTDKSGAIYAKVDVEVSSIDPSVTVLGIPGFLKRKSTAEFNARDGETVVLNGMYSFEGSKSTQKLPGLGNLPLVGGLFGDKSRSTATREVAIVITPRVITPTANPNPGARDLNKQKLYEFDKSVRDHDLLPNKAAPLLITE